MAFRFKKLKAYQWVLLSIETLIIFAMVLAPVNGVILPIGKEVCEAYDILASTNTGKELIKRVRRASRGSYVYLTLGETERENLMDYSGRKVRGLTRVTSGFGDVKYQVFNISVITNKDITGHDPIEILKNIAFELENVAYVFKNPYAQAPKDSPRSRNTRQAVLRELAMRK